MNFNTHFNLKGQHAFLSASNYHWLNYDEEKLKETYNNKLAAERGTRLHNLASELILLGQKLPRSNKTLNMYVNDAIGFKMVPEQILYYSDNCFGTADTISFRDNLLRIHDYKSGVTPAKMEQLFIYAALFCLEYDYRPSSIDIELRLYQNDEIEVCNPTADIIMPVVDKIITYDKIIKRLKEQEG